MEIRQKQKEKERQKIFAFCLVALTSLFSS